MNLVPTALDGCFTVIPTMIRDDRGFFARVFCAKEFRDRGLEPVTAQTSISFNHRKGTLRGLHYQLDPHSEAKLVRCIRGSVFDVAVDLRQHSPTYLSWTSVELSADNRIALYLGRGLAHGYLTLQDDTELLYQISQPYNPDAARGIAWDDPTVGIEWPTVTELTISDRDLSLPKVIRRQQ